MEEEGAEQVDDPQPQEQKQVNAAIREPIYQYYAPEKWLHIFEKLSSLFLTGQEFVINAGVFTQCCDHQTTFIITGRPQRRVANVCCHPGRQAEGMVVPCWEICPYSKVQKPRQLLLKVQACSGAALAHRHHLLLAVAEKEDRDDTDTDTDTEDEDDAITSPKFFYAPDAFVAWLEK